MKTKDVRYQDFSWKNNKLYLKNKWTGVMIGPDQIYTQLYRFGHNNFVSDIFNKNRVKDNAVKYVMEDLN